MTLVPDRAFFSGDIKGYTAYGGEEYEYTKKHAAGTATAWADIENPTDKTLQVTVTLEFEYQHLFLSNDRLEGTIKIKPRSKTRLYISANTRGFVGNRTVAGVRQLDVVSVEP